MLTTGGAAKCPIPDLAAECAENAAWRAVLAPLISVGKKIDQVAARSTHISAGKSRVPACARLVLGATGYFKPGSPLQGLGPFHAHKERKLSRLFSAVVR